VVAAAGVVAALKFFQCCGEAFHRLEIRGVEGLILVGVLFLLDGRQEKNNCCGKEAFPRARSALLAVQQVTAVRYN
jgi:hypothetical protein